MCHQKSKEPIQLSSNYPTPELGWVVGRPLAVGPLAPPRATGHPAAGRRVRAVPVLPLRLCTRRPARARARPSIFLGVKARLATPAPRQLPWTVESPQPPRAGDLAGG
jgi:hypothetical protein